MVRLAGSSDTRSHERDAPDAFEGSRWWVPATVAVVTVAALAVHWRALGKPYFFDDWEWLDLSHRDGWVRIAMSPEHDIFRPVLAGLFAVMERTFGLSARPFHLLLVCEIVGVALLVVLLARQLGLPRVHASAAGVFYATFGPLALLLIWTSTSDIPVAVACCIAAVVLVVGGTSTAREVAAALILLLGVATREFAIVTPLLAVLALVAVSSGAPLDVSTLARRTRALWAVSILVGVTRLALGAGAHHGPYEIKWFGKHVFSNFAKLAKITGRFGVPTSGRLLNVVIVVFWLVLVGGAVWALRRGDRLPAIGLVWWFVAVLPFLPLPNHAMDPYYLALPAVGLAITGAALLRHLPGGVPAVAVVTVAFVVVQMFAVRDYTLHAGFNLAIDRSDAMRAVAHDLDVTDGVVTVVTHCDRDQDLSKNGELFREVLGQPDLEVQFRVVEPRRC